MQTSLNTSVSFPEDIVFKVENYRFDSKLSEFSLLGVADS